VDKTDHNVCDTQHARHRQTTDRQMNES